MDMDIQLEFNLLRSHQNIINYCCIFVFNLFVVQLGHILLAHSVYKEGSGKGKEG